MYVPKNNIPFQRTATVYWYLWILDRLPDWIVGAIEEERELWHTISESQKNDAIRQVLWPTDIEYRDNEIIDPRIEKFLSENKTPLQLLENSKSKVEYLEQAWFFTDWDKLDAVTKKREWIKAFKVYNRQQNRKAIGVFLSKLYQKVNCKQLDNLMEQFEATSISDITQFTCLMIYLNNYQDIDSATNRNNSYNLVRKDIDRALQSDPFLRESKDLLLWDYKKQNKKNFGKVVKKEFVDLTKDEKYDVLDEFMKWEATDIWEFMKQIKGDWDKI